VIIIKMVNLGIDILQAFMISLSDYEQIVH
jgi:hypothetical protein